MTLVYFAVDFGGLLRGLRQFEALAALAKTSNAQRMNSSGVQPAFCMNDTE